MPNWVINRLILEGEEASNILKEYLTKDGNDNFDFDFNKIKKMPEDLKIEKSSRSSDGLKLYIASINPLVSDFSWVDKKVKPNDFFKIMISIFKRDCIDNIERYILKNSEISLLIKKYDKDLEAILNLGKKVFDNYKNYGVPDWYEWSILNWGCKWNTCNTVLLDDKSVSFDTPWSPSVEAINTFSKKHTNLKITYEYAEEQTGFYSGRITYENGAILSNVEFEPFSKEAYEMSFSLWGSEDSYSFNEESNTYEYIEEEDR